MRRSALTWRRSVSALCCLGGLLGGLHQARAVDFSAEATTAVRGQALALTLALYTQAGETLKAECISADVMDGERLLSGPDLLVSLRAEDQEGTWTAQLVTRTPITHPLVKVTVSAGCGQRLWRRYTLRTLPSPQQGASAAQAVALPATEPPVGLAWWLGGGAALLAAGGVVAWRIQRPAKAQTGRQALAPSATTFQVQPLLNAATTTPARPTQSSAAPVSKPRRPTPPAPLPSLPAPLVLRLAGKPTPPPTPAQEPEQAWPEVEEQANTLAAQGLLGKAAEVVMSHVRSMQRAQFMPYLKLLQLQRRRGDRAGFDDTRALMEQKFKLHAPRWSGQACSLPAESTAGQCGEPPAQAQDTNPPTRQTDRS